MQAVLDRWANRRQIVPPELTGRIAPTRLGGSTCAASSASRWNVTPVRSCRQLLQRKRVLAAEIDHANRLSATD